MIIRVDFEKTDSNHSASIASQSSRESFAAIATQIMRDLYAQRLEQRTRWPHRPVAFCLQGTRGASTQHLTQRMLRQTKYREIVVAPQLRPCIRAQIQCPSIPKPPSLYLWGCASSFRGQIISTRSHRNITAFGAFMAKSRRGKQGVVQESQAQTGSMPGQSLFQQNHS